MNMEGSPLDLNHLPEDFTRDGKQVSDDTSTSGQRKKKSQGNDDESGKVYECRFCSLKFCKSQALGGHMNRHRQERETEALNKARQLVYSSDPNLAAHPHPTLGSYVPPAAATVYPPPPPHQVYPTQPLMYPGSGSTVMQQSRQQYHHPHHQSCVYTSSTPPRLGGDYYMAHGHAVTGSSHFYNDSGTNYTCIGAPVGVHGLGPGARDGLDREEGGIATGSWGRGHHQQHHHLDPPY